MIQKCSIFKVFGEFAKRPNKTFQVREISKLIELSPISVKNHITKLEDLKLIKEDNSGIYRGYIANAENEDFIFYKRLANIIRLKESGLINHLKDIFEEPEAIVLFGSFSFGEDFEGSDIDIAVKTKIEKDVNLEKYEKILGHNTHITPLDEKTEENLYKSITNGIVLSGKI